MTTSAASSSSSRKPTTRPSVWRQLGALYLDVLACAFVAWVICFTFGWQAYWDTLALFLWMGEFFWCRDRLQPTVGKFCMGIRYLTSSSSQVVADIQVIHSKLRLNGFLLSAGVAELTLALAFLGGWTFLNKAAVWNFQVAPALSWTFWVGAGLAFFVCGASILSGSRTAQEIFLVVHSALCADILKSGPAWESLAKDPASFTHWVPLALMNGLRASLPFLPEVFIVLSAAGVVILFFSRRHLVN